MSILVIWTSFLLKRRKKRRGRKIAVEVRTMKEIEVPVGIGTDQEMIVTQIGIGKEINPEIDQRVEIEVGRKIKKETVQGGVGVEGRGEKEAGIGTEAVTVAIEIVRAAEM